MKLTKITTDKKTGQQVYHFDIGKGIKARTGFLQLRGKKDNQDMIAGLIREGVPKEAAPYRGYVPGLGGYQNRSEWMPRYFANGGLAKGTDTVPAMLTPGEYVMNKAAVNRYGIGLFNSLNQMKAGASSPSVINQSLQSSSSVVYLSDTDRDLLRRAIDRPVALYTNDRTIAESANSGNKELARRGSR
jgi:hypothetical protein